MINGKIVTMNESEMDRIKMMKWAATGRITNRYQAHELNNSVSFSDSSAPHTQLTEHA